MTPEERILAAINLEPYDRVPVAPHINSEFPMRHKGRPVSDAYDQAFAGLGFQAILDVFDEVGGWDAQTLCRGGVPTTPSCLRRIALGYGDRMKFPGLDARISVNTSPRFEEREILMVEEYDEISNLGWDRFLEKNLGRLTKSVLGSAVDSESMPVLAETITNEYMKARDIWRFRGVPVISGALLSDPQMVLSLFRTLPQFTLDLYRRPDRVQAALEAMVDDFAKGAIESMKAAGSPSPTGIPGIMVSCERGSGSYYNLDIFERFVWPYIKRLVEAWAAAGYVTTLHFDTDWTLNLPYLLELPRKVCICELDSTTDIFKAKEILKDHMCIMGDVPPALSAYGTPEDMKAYCQKLIDIVGKDTGFILSTGCAVPPDTKFENYKMMTDTAKNYPPPRST